MHTLTWHPDPPALLDGCRRALRPGGYGIVLAYARPPHVVDTVRELCGQDGPAAAGRALRWLVPTAIFEALRHGPRRYLGRDDLARTLTHAGFHILELRSTFLAGLSLLAWVRRT
jgi:SAM-dependent methyltransferase